MGKIALDRLFETRRFCYVIPDDGYVKGEGWRPAVVFEREPGYYPVGDWPCEGKLNQKRPWFWGHRREDAEQAAEAMNERLGITPKMAATIIGSSMGAAREVRRVRRA